MTSADTDLALGTKVTLPATTNSATVAAINDANNSRHPNSYWYYQWKAATANSGGINTITATGQIAPDSICPKGWQLPLSGTAIIKGVSTNTDTVSGSFKYLLNAYDITNISQMMNIGEQPPLSFVRAGNLDSNGIAGAGSVGHYWSRVASSDTSAYDFVWHSGDFSVAHSGLRYLGYSVRCIARQVAR